MDRTFEGNCQKGWKSTLIIMLRSVHLRNSCSACHRTKNALFAEERPKAHPARRRVGAVRPVGVNLKVMSQNFIRNLLKDNFRGRKYFIFYRNKLENFILHEKKNAKIFASIKILKT